MQKQFTAPYFTVYLDTNHRILCVKCEIHSIPILTHHIRISSTYVSSVMLSPNNLEIRNVVTVKTRTPPQKCREMELITSNYRAMHGRDCVCKGVVRGRN